MTLLRRPFTPKPRSNYGERCGTCAHGWHGLECRSQTCPCPTSWVQP